MKTVLFIFGTRPEAIKMAPLIHEFRRFPDQYSVKICVTAQHRELLDQVLDFFGIEPDVDLSVMSHNQSLSALTAKCLHGLDNTISSMNPDLVFVQGDTTTAFCGALAAFYRHVRIAHLEAGLRSGSKRAPFPEEGNRILAGHLADFHFAPTELARTNLKREGVDRNVWVVGNTVIDALFMGLKILESSSLDEEIRNRLPLLDISKRIILVTAHRRESFGEPMKRIMKAIRVLSETHQNCQFVYPIHPNPNVKNVAQDILADCSNVLLIEPVSYPTLIWLMNQAYLVITDSGGIQEEAPSLGKPVIVLREVTERTEGVEAGNAILVGTNVEKITRTAEELLSNTNAYREVSSIANPYGDGCSSRRVVELLCQELDN